MKICPNPKTRGKMLPWQKPPVMASPIKAKTQMATQTKNHRPAWKPWAQAIRKGNSLKNLLTTMQCKGLSPQDHRETGV